MPRHVMSWSGLGVSLVLRITLENHMSRGASHHVLSFHSIRERGPTCDWVINACTTEQKLACLRWCELGSCL